jgi:hypothetical protein
MGVFSTSLESIDSMNFLPSNTITVERMME